MTRAPLALVLLPLVRTRAILGIAVAQLRRSPGRTVLAVLSVALAVLAVTLLASLGAGVVATGEEGLDNANRDIWISSDPVDPDASGTENPIVGAHGTAAELTQRDDVTSASPLALQDVYVGTDPDPAELQRHPAIGVQETHDGFDFRAGGGFETPESAYETDQPRSDDPVTNEIVLDPRVADELDAEVGDTVYVGTSRQTAPEYEFTVVGVSDYYSQYLGSETVTMPLVDLQAVAGTTGTDRATFLTADVADDADREAVAADLDESYPEYDVRTSDEQVEAMIGERPLVVASGATLVGLAVVGGVVLTVNLFALVAAQQREELAALRAVGLSRRLLAGTVAAQGLVIGLLGGFVGIAATPLLASGLNRFAASIASFDGLVRTSTDVYVLGIAIALVVGTVVALVAGWRAGRYATIDHLEG
ncbi:putative ABC transport system permease protein [Halobiforma haloterrestris]|uniref:Putative ABC transport system permease protein n=1 Tax=Natronobacterium haloterrestre TaxID=148448 RepID=A0A1I1FKV5_NATHA|nr:ABC transporter permease [Halobiforma haloterrestris]SFB99632.1 putative ABC transport system permease protein [Halobiforma haloterrestris]